MTSRDFCYWLQGVFEVGGLQALDKTQVTCIQRHLDMVFKHEIDPSFGKDNPVLDKIHNPNADGPIMRC